MNSKSSLKNQKKEIKINLSNIKENIKDTNDKIKNIQKDEKYNNISNSIDNKTWVDKTDFNYYVNLNRKLLTLENTLDKLKENKKQLKTSKQNVNEELKKMKNIKTHLINNSYDKNLLKIFDKAFTGKKTDIKLLDEKIHYRNNRIIEISYDKYNYTTDTIQEIADYASKLLKDNHIDGVFSVVLKYDGEGWRSGKFRNIGEDADLFDFTESYSLPTTQDNFKHIRMYAIIKPKAEGGTSKLNDCLYFCLKEYLHHRLPWEKPIELKNYLKLKRCDKIPISLIPKIETKLKTFQINITGDYIYSSQVKSNKIIKLILKDEHYSVDRTEFKKISGLVYYHEKPIMLYDKLTYEGYNGNELKILTKEELHLYKFDISSPYIFYPRKSFKTKDKITGEVKEITIIEEYEELIKNANILKEETKGLINLYKTGNVKNTALHLFERFTKFLSNPEEIQQDEQEWINNSKKGALIYSEKGYTGKAYKYDIKSMYPSLLISNGSYPIKRGEFMTITNEEFSNCEYFKFGIYRVNIEKSQNQKINPLFRFNNTHYYTHTSLEHAKKLNLKMTLIIDDKPNFLYYSRDKLINYKETFYEYVIYLYELKEKNIPMSKLILNILWGAFSELNSKTDYTTTKQINILDEITEIKPSKFDGHVIKSSTLNKMFKSNFARLTPFLLSKGRLTLCNILLPIIDNVKQFHTDGFITTSNESIITGDKIGELKYLGYCDNCIIENTNMILGDFK